MSFVWSCDLSCLWLSESVCTAKAYCACESMPCAWYRLVRSVYSIQQQQYIRLLSILFIHPHPDSQFSIPFPSFQTFPKSIQLPFSRSLISSQRLSLPSWPHSLSYAWAVWAQYSVNRVVSSLIVSWSAKIKTQLVLNCKFLTFKREDHLGIVFQ